jgi:hypothetical protein
LWIGDALGSLERACLRSVQGQGHSLALYCYRQPSGVPENVEIRDASEVLPESSIIRHESGSVALFSDWFRYELLASGVGTWIDTDLYLVAPMDMDRPYLFGRQIVSPVRPWRWRARDSINGCVLRVPPESPMLPPLIGQFTDGSDLGQRRWGAAGPFALTEVAGRCGLISEALPSEVFNPVPWYEARWIRDPKRALAEVVTKNTVAVQLWNECIKSFKDELAPAGSFLARLQKEGA